MVQVGICHSDYHQVMNEWGNTKFPVVPGCAANMLHSISPRTLAHASGTHVSSKVGEVGCVIETPEQASADLTCGRIFGSSTGPEIV